MAGTTAFDIGQAARPAGATAGLAQNQIPNNAIFGEFFNPVKSLAQFAPLGQELDNYNNAIQGFYGNAYDTQVHDKLNADLAERGLSGSQLGGRQMAEATRNFFAPANANVAQISAQLFGQLGAPFAAAGAEQLGLEQKLAFLENPANLGPLINLIKQLSDAQTANDLNATRSANQLALESARQAQQLSGPNSNLNAIQSALGGGGGAGGGGGFFSGGIDALLANPLPNPLRGGADTQELNFALGQTNPNIFGGQSPAGSTFFGQPSAEEQIQQTLSQMGLVLPDGGGSMFGTRSASDFIREANPAPITNFGNGITGTGIYSMDQLYGGSGGGGTMADYANDQYKDYDGPGLFPDDGQPASYYDNNSSWSSYYGS